MSGKVRTKHKVVNGEELNVISALKTILAVFGATEFYLENNITTGEWEIIVEWGEPFPVLADLPEEYKQTLMVHVDQSLSDPEQYKKDTNGEQKET